MEINSLRLFLEVSEVGSFTKVAAQKHTVQSHISKQISDLEKVCGAALFRRTGRGVVLTEFGHVVAQRTRAWIKQSDEFFAYIRQSSNVPMGEVKIGVLPSAAHPLMTHVFSRLRLEFPLIRLNMREGQGSELDALLDTGSVDMAILFRHKKPNGHDETLLSTADTYLVSGLGITPSYGETVDFKRLEGVPLVLPRHPSHWRSILDETARSKGFSFSVELEADSLRLQKEVVASNVGLYALLGSFSISEELRSGRLQASKVVAPELKRYVALTHARQGHFTPASRIVSQLIKDTVAEWNCELVSPAS